MSTRSLTRRRTNPAGPDASRWAARASTAALVILVALLMAVGLGAISASGGTLAILLAVGVLGIGIVSTDIGLMTVLCFPAALIMIRSGPLSVADLVLAAATLAAVVLNRPHKAKNLEPLIWLGVFYLACLVPTLLLNRYAGNVIEWGHEAFMIIGSLLVGWVAGHRGQARAALTSFVLACCLIGIAAFIAAIFMLMKDKHFGPVYLPFMHKNFIGNSLAIAFAMVYVRPDWLRWSKTLTGFAMVTCAAGIAASGSRQAVVSVFAAILVLTLRSPRYRRGIRMLLPLALIPAIWFTASTVVAQLNSDNTFNSTSQRLTWYTETLDVWQQSPLLGVGLRWWNTGNYVSFQPPNAELEMLSSGGIVGLIGFLVLMVGGVWIVMLLDPRYGNIALAVMITRFTQGQLDLYWVAGQSALPWMVAGVVLGVQALDNQAGVPRAAGTGSAETSTIRALPRPARPARGHEPGRPGQQPISTSVPRRAVRS